MEQPQPPQDYIIDTTDDVIRLLEHQQLDIQRYAQKRVRIFILGKMLSLGKIWHKLIIRLRRQWGLDAITHPYR